MHLDLTSLVKAVESLKKALEVARPENLENMTEDQRDVIKAGVIQNFEFTYELCWKFIKRWIETNVSPFIADGVTRRELFRLAAENRLIDDVENWMRHHEARNLTAHTYQAAMAEKVYQAARPFARDAERLLQALEARND